MATLDPNADYRGRLAPSPTGLFHAGHARTFMTAFVRARAHCGTLALRWDDLDGPRCRPEFVQAGIEDLHWLGINWDEGDDCGGSYGPYSQSKRIPLYAAALEQLRRAGLIYPCICTRKDIASAVGAPHAENEEPIYPGTCRNRSISVPDAAMVTWRFRVQDGRQVMFEDGRMGAQCFGCGRDFGDFVVWRSGNVPSYQLACVVDDAAMRITEVVRGADLLSSTARQILLQEALGLVSPSYFHCPLTLDVNGRRLAKRHDSLSIQVLRQKGLTPEAVAGWGPATKGNDLQPDQ